MPAVAHTKRAHAARTEKAVQRDVTRLLQSLGYHVSDTSQPRASMVTPGLPDLYAQREPFAAGDPHAPNAFWVEVKSPRGSLRTSQEAWHAAALAAGVRVVVARSASDLLPTLRELGAPIS